jgi:hypothetical protein
MRTILVVERFNRRGNLIEVRRQLSQSYTTDFIRLLYTQQAQAATYNSPAAVNLGLASPPGRVVYLYGHGCNYGIVVGRGTTPPSPSDVALEYPIGHGRTYVASLQPKLINPSFETGDFTGWATSNPGSIVEGGFPGSGGKYYWYTGVGVATRWISQSLDFTNVTGIKLAYYLYAAALPATLSLLYNGTTFFSDTLGSGGINRQIIVPVSTSGTKTLKIQVVTAGGGAYMQCDSIEVYGTQLEYGGSECTFPTFSGPNGEMTLRRYLYNRSGSSITINEVGLVALPGRLILRDIVSPGIVLADGETLRVVYAAQIIV